MIVIEGLDGCGKQTQTELLANRLEGEGYKVKLISFPYYGKWHCAFVEKQLKGGFGDKPTDINPYKASQFYALDRLGAYVEEWKVDYEDKDTIIIADRYVGSNMIYQSAKIDNLQDKLKFLKWLDDLEYVHNELPRADITVCLCVKPEISQKLIDTRTNKVTEKDIYEKDIAYLNTVYTNIQQVIKHQGWYEIECSDGEHLLSIEDIADKLYDKVKKYL